MAALRTRRSRAAVVNAPAAAPAAACEGDAAPAGLAAVSTSPPPPPPSLRRPRKVLYEKSAFEDDHTDETFLEELVLNLNVRPRSYWVVVRDSVAVAQQVSVTVGAALVFYFMQAGALHPDALLAVNAALLAAGFALRCALGGPRRGALQSAREAVVLTGGVHALAPLFHTLTSSISGDTIAACVATSLIAHLYLHDYSPGADVTQSIGGSLSLGAATFASVLLASRLPTPRHVAALMLFALQAFVAWPFLRRDLARTSRAAHTTLALLLHVATLSALGRVNGLLAGVHATSLLSITFVCPYALVRWSHNLKRRINGPWDEARLQLRNS